MKHLTALVLILIAAPAFAADLTIPTATVVKIEESPADSVRLPDQPWTSDTVTPATEGMIRKSVMRLANARMTTLQLIDPLRKALIDDGYTVTFTCADLECGGFDFRFQLDLIGEPDMHVDLGNYRYLLAEKPGAEPHTIALVASSAGNTGFVHVTEVSDGSFPEITVDPTPPESSTPPETSRDGLIDTLVETGRTVLDDMDFGSGSAELDIGADSSLSTLADWLIANPGARIVLVGHTDATGSLEANTALSRLRASAVATRLIDLGAAPAQVQFEGAGYLAPLSTNLTDEGRALNRRVEAVLLSLDP